MAQWLKRVKKTLSAYWFDATLLIAAVGAPLFSASLSFDTGRDDWFQRSGSLMVLISTILEFRQGYAALEAWAAVKRRSSAGVAVLGQLPTPRKAIAVIALALVVLGTIIWGYGDLMIKEFLVP